jgi:hypothetical protein
MRTVTFCIVAFLQTLQVSLAQTELKDQLMATNHKDGFDFFNNYFIETTYHRESVFQVSSVCIVNKLPLKYKFYNQFGIQSELGKKTVSEVINYAEIKNCQTPKSAATEKGWKFFSDPMGDKSYAFCEADGVSGMSLSYRNDNLFKEWGFIFDRARIYSCYGNNDPNNYQDIVVKFKINGEIVNLEDYIKNKYPNYKGYSLKVIKQYGGFVMAGYDSNYKYRAVGKDGSNLSVDLAIMENLKKASLVSIDYDGKRYYYSTIGFQKAIDMCK